MSEYRIDTSASGPQLPHRLGKIRWGPLLVTAVVAFGVAFGIGLERAGALNAGNATSAEALRHLGAGVMFIGFASVLAAISFAIARILGVFRDGGVRVQTAARATVQSLATPRTARAFILLMAVAMMAVLGGSVAHLVVGAQIAAGSAAALAGSDTTFLLWEGVRRMGVATYLVAITFGLATIVTVLRFQSHRLVELSR